MSNTSATGGYLTPDVASPPLEDDALDALFQTVVVGITGLPGSMVRPRWQPTVPKMPEPSVDWCAIGVMSVKPDDGPAIEHSSTGEGSDSLVRHETLEVLATFYGPNSMRYAAQLRDGLGIVQNNEVLHQNNAAYITSGDIRAVPELVNLQWVKRRDITLTFRREVNRTYSVLNIVGAEGTITAENAGGNLIVNNF